MYRRIISVVLLIVLIMCCCASCTQNEDEMPENALSVYCPSDEITYIVPGEYPANYAEDGEAFKWGYNVFVSKMNADDKLVLSANRNEGLGRTSLTSSGTYYKSGDWFGYAGGVYLGSEKVIDEECVGMVASWGDGSAVLIITNTDDNSYIYSAVLVGGQWQLNKNEKLELGSETNFIFYDWAYYPIMTCSPTDTMYVVTEDNLITLSVGDYLDDKCGDFSTITKTVIETPEYWHYLRPTSAVELNEKLYIGDMFGVVEFDINSKKVIYYPINLKSMR